MAQPPWGRGLGSWSVRNLQGREGGHSWPRDLSTGLRKPLTACFSSSAGAAPLCPGPRWAGACAHPGRLRPPGRGGRGVRGHRCLWPHGQTSPRRPQAGRCPWAGRGRGHVHAPGQRPSKPRSPRGIGVTHRPPGPVTVQTVRSAAAAGSAWASRLPGGRGPAGQCGSRKGGPERCCGDTGSHYRQLRSVGSWPARPPASPCLQLNALLAAGPKGEGRPRRQEGQSKLVPGRAWPGGPARPPCA